MALRRILKVSNDKAGKLASVYRDSEWQEYRVKHHQDGIYLEAADYHTGDRTDAISHAEAWVISKP